MSRLARPVLRRLQKHLQPQQHSQQRQRALLHSCSSMTHAPAAAAAASCGTAATAATARTSVRGSRGITSSPSRRSFTSSSNNSNSSGGGVRWQRVAASQSTFVAGPWQQQQQQQQRWHGRRQQDQAQQQVASRAVRVYSSLTSEVAGSGSTEMDYDASKIQVLEGLEPVRKRPGMYIGSTCVKGLHHLLYEVLDNSIDEAQAGHATRVHVLVGADRRWVQITDDGRGIPVDVHPTTGVSALETVLTVLHAGGKFGGESSGYKVSGGLHGVGVSVCNALSSSLSVSVLRDGKSYSQTYERGKPVTELESHDVTLESNGGAEEKEWTRNSGTSIKFVPDDLIFDPTLKLDDRTIASRLRELAFLNSGVEIHFEVEGNEPQVFHFTGGIREYAEWLNRDKDTLHPAFSFEGEGEDGVQVAIAMQWCSDSFSDTVLGYANSVRTIDGGTHFDGLRAALTRNVNSCARKMNKLKDSDSNLLGEYIREGLTCVISTKVPNPEFQGQTKTRLGNPEVRRAVESTVSSYMPDFFELNPSVLDNIVAKAMQAMKAAEAAKRARELVRRKSVLRPSSLPGKLADCACQDPAMSEIFIVEGESAGGSAKMARSRLNQAILPLKGKILNVEKKDDTKIYKNTEISNLIMALGLGFRGEDLDVDNLRYHKIIILTDADVDGAHIRTLLLTFLYRYQSDLFKHGFVYVGMPPLYMVQSSKGKSYCYDDKHLQQTLDELGDGVSYTIQRFKGLGEMMPQQLWDTTMDPERRFLKRISVDDAAETDRMFRVLMGDQVGPRKELILNECENLERDDLDI